MDFSAVPTVLATGLVTGAIAVISAWLTNRAAAQRARDERSARTQDDVAGRTREASRLVVELFYTLEASVRWRHERGDDDDHELWGDHWNENVVPALILAIEAIPHASARRELMMLCEAVGSREFPLSDHGLFYNITLIADLGRRVAASYMRGEDPDAEQQAELDLVKRRLIK